jgi:hypothetical protein
MTKLAFGPKCPYCKDMAKITIKRRFWMRIVPGTKYYHCSWCGGSFFTILTAIAIEL